MLLSAEMARNLYDVMDVHSMWHRLCFLGALSCFLSRVSFFFGPFQGVHRLQCLRIALEVGVCNRCMVFVSGWNVIYVKHYFL